MINLNKHSAILNYYNWVVISVTRCYNKKCPNISSFCLKMMFFHKSPRSNQIFGLLLKENWQLKAFKNRPIWSHRQCLIFLNKIIDGHLQKSKFANLKLPSTPMIRVWILLRTTVFSLKFLFEKNKNKQQKRSGLAHFLNKNQFNLLDDFKLKVSNLVTKSYFSSQMLYLN